MTHEQGPWENPHFLEAKRQVKGKRRDRERTKESRSEKIKKQMTKESRVNGRLRVRKGGGG